MHNCTRNPPGRLTGSGGRNPNVIYALGARGARSSRRLKTQKITTVTGVNLHLKTRVYTGTLQHWRTVSKETAKTGASLREEVKPSFPFSFHSICKLIVGATHIQSGSSLLSLCKLQDSRFNLCKEKIFLEECTKQEQSLIVYCTQLDTPYFYVSGSKVSLHQHHNKCTSYVLYVPQCDGYHLPW